MVTIFDKIHKEYLGTWKFAKTWKFSMGICSKLTTETLKHGMKYVQSYELRHQNNINDVEI